MQRKLKDLQKRAEKAPCSEWAADVAEKTVATIGSQVEGVLAAASSLRAVREVTHDANDDLEDAVKLLELSIDLYRYEREKHTRVVGRILKLAAEIRELAGGEERPQLPDSTTGEGKQE